MRHVFYICFFLLGGYGLLAQPPQKINQWYEYKGLNTDSVLLPPYSSTTTMWQDGNLWYNKLQKSYHYQTPGKDRRLPAPTYTYGPLFNGGPFTQIAPLLNAGATSVSVSGGNIAFASGSTSGTQALYYPQPWNEENFTMELDEVVGPISSTSFGGAVGLIPIDSFVISGMNVAVDLSNTATAGLLQIHRIVSGVSTVIASSPTAISFSQGDVISIFLKRIGSTFTAVAYDKTTAGTPVSLGYTYNLLSQSILVPNTVAPGIYSYGSGWSCSALSININQTIGGGLMVIGDSKMFYINAYNSMRIPSQLDNYYPPVQAEGGPGDRINDKIRCAQVYIALHPDHAAISIGTNDFAAGQSVDSVWHLYETLVDTLQHNGIPVIHLEPFFETAGDQDSLAELRDSIIAKYPDSTVIDAGWTSLQNNPNAYLSADGVHPNASGDSLIVTNIVNSGKIPGRFQNPPVYPDNQWILNMANVYPPFTQSAAIQVGYGVAGQTFLPAAGTSDTSNGGLADFVDAGQTLVARTNGANLVELFGDGHYNDNGHTSVNHFPLWCQNGTERFNDQDLDFYLSGVQSMQLSSNGLAFQSNDTTHVKYEFKEGSFGHTQTYFQVDGTTTNPGVTLAAFLPLTSFPALEVKGTGDVLVGTSTDDQTAQLNVASTTKGFLPPRMTTTQRLAISTPTEGLMVYDLTLHQMFYWNGTAWTVL